MIGIFVWSGPQEGRFKRTVALREETVLHTRFLFGEISRGPKTPEALLRRRVLSAAKQMRKRGVTRVVAPEGFSYGPYLEKAGLRLFSTVPLRKRLAADWVKVYLGRRGLSQAGAKVAVAAAQMTGELVRTVTELSLRHRYVLLDVPYGGEELCRRLRREYGVSLLLSPEKGQIQGADVAVLFDPRPELEQEICLPVYREDVPLPPLVLPPAVEDRLPKGICRERFAAALMEAGALRPGQISLG